MSLSACYEFIQLCLAVLSSIFWHFSENGLMPPPNPDANLSALLQCCSHVPLLHVDVIRYRLCVCDCVRRMTSYITPPKETPLRRTARRPPMKSSLRETPRCGPAAGARVPCQEPLGGDERARPKFWLMNILEKQIDVSSVGFS